MNPKAEPERGSASLLLLTFALLLLGVSALGAIEIGQFGARRAELRKIEALALRAMEHAGGQGDLACTLTLTNPAITCEFGGGEIRLRRENLPVVRVGWQGFAGEFR